MLCYNYYVVEYGGTSLSPENWETRGLQAERYLAYLADVFEMSPRVKDGEKLAVCALAESMQTLDDLKTGKATGPVSSEKVGSVSVSYAVPAGGGYDLSSSGTTQTLLSAISPYVHLYAGVG